ncbi:MAG TPA: phosphatidylserine/phosphatidylglycerophosphate/cardiolipin synthase family protein [Caulobacteraceae bacterium]|nr:phosphatidylserine/phosphatidylglycerophosphate/cardiolipin synthase family protein [Caulobacteraceae bacterium]
MPRFELLVGAGAFWRRAAADLAGARRRVLVQAMTFEGDAAGKMAAADIAASPARDRRLLVDDYSRHMISDRFVHAPSALLDRAFRAEVRDTHALFAALVRAGVGVRITNPVGPLFVRYPARNHKKLIVVDDAAYLGGVNFSDHNFAWHDFMLRIEDTAFADACADDFDATWAGRPVASHREMGDLTLISMDGRQNLRSFEAVMALVEGAQRRITVISPYLTFPMTDALRAAAGRGVAVELITPRDNNKAMVRDYLLAEAADAGFQVRLLPGMSHLKGLVIDDEALIVGSSNFDFVSLGAEEEIVVVARNPDLVAEFRRLVVGPALAEALPDGAYAVDRAAARKAERTLRLAARIVALARNAPRGVVEVKG